MHLLNTLYVNTQDSYLRLDNDTLRVLVDEETRLRVPLHHLQAVVCFGRVGICRIPDDCIDSKRYPLFIAREAMRALVYDLTQAQGEST